MTEYPSFAGIPESTLCMAAGCRQPARPDDDEDAPPVPRTAVRGTGLCSHHHARFPLVVNDLVGLWGMLEHSLFRRRGGSSNSKVQSSSVLDMSSMWNPHAAQVRTDVAEWTQFLVRLVLRDHPLPAPDVRNFQRPVATRDPKTGEVVRKPEFYTHTVTFEHRHMITASTPTPVALAALAAHYGRWLSSYPGVWPLGPALLDDALVLRRHALAAVEAAPVRRIGSGLLCGQASTDTGYEMLRCDAPMAVLLDQDGRPGLMVCSEHPKAHRTYTPDEWLTFAPANGVADAG